jgi:hypothetical protein
MVAQATALVVVCIAYLFANLPRAAIDGADDDEDNYVRVPRAVVDVERQANVDKIYNCTNIESVNILRMRKAPFFQLVNLFRERHLLENNINSFVEEQVAMFLHIMGHNQRFRVIQHTFRRSLETVSRYFAQVLYTVGELRGELIRSNVETTNPKILRSRRWYPYFKVHFVLCTLISTTHPMCGTDGCMFTILGLYRSYRWHPYPCTSAI